MGNAMKKCWIPLKLKKTKAYVNKEDTQMYVLLIGPAVLETQFGRL